MISIVFTILILIGILEGNIYYKDYTIDGYDKVCKDLLIVAKLRYLEAYKNVPDHKMDVVFDRVIKHIRFVDGDFCFHDAYTFKHVLVDAVSVQKYNGDVNRSEAMFIMDFMMEAYHEVSSKYSTRFEINLNVLKEYI